ncbi:MAG: hypothetical protein ACT4OO_10635, partial [Nitrospiraceae bacterium]
MKRNSPDHPREFEEVNRRKFLARGASLLAAGTASFLLTSGQAGQAEERRMPTDPRRVPGALPRPYGERSPFV